MHKSSIFFYFDAVPGLLCAYFAVPKNEGKDVLLLKQW